MKPAVFLTGATGFLGMEVLARLLERTDHDVLCLVRAGDADAAEARLDAVLATLYNDPAAYRGRVPPGTGQRAQRHHLLVHPVGFRILDQEVPPVRSPHQRAVRPGDTLAQIGLELGEAERDIGRQRPALNLVV